MPRPKKYEDVVQRQFRLPGELNERLVARYIDEVTFERPLSHPYIWPTQIW